MQASITALPPPDQWNDHVLAYLGGIGVDHYRGLLHNTVLKMKELLFSSMRHGLQHSSYQQLLDVRISRWRLLLLECGRGSTPNSILAFPYFGIP